MTTVYLASAARDELDRAQAEIDRHLAVRPNGLCATCGEVEPCASRTTATVTFNKYGRLPQRRPGIAGPQRSLQAEAPQVGSRFWFAESTRTTPTSP